MTTRALPDVAGLSVFHSLVLISLLVFGATVIVGLLILWFDEAPVEPDEPDRVWTAQNSTWKGGPR